MALDSPPFRLFGRSPLCISPSSSSCISPVFAQGLKLRSKLTIVSAASKDNKNINKRKKEDRHSFVPKSDEAGIFPEAVLLKERKVEEDGKLVPEFADVEERELFESLNLLLESDMDVDRKLEKLSAAEAVLLRYMNLPRLRHYEVVYLIHEDHKEAVETVNAKVLEFLKEKKGRLWRVSDWGMRRLAYSIKKAKNAHYMLMNFEVEAKWIDEFKSMLDRDERVIRHLVMKKDRAETADCPPPPDFFSVRADMNGDDQDLDEEYDDDDEGIIYVEDDDEDEDEDDQEMNGGFSRSAESKQIVGHI